MRLPRMTTRRWMIAVAIVGLILGAVSTHRSFRLWNTADAHWERSLSFRVVGTNQHPDLSRRHRRYEYHLWLAVKYAEAARYPWLPVEPDPPEPK
jgi:hypothetical protein